jgi:hypothetical protein
LTSTTKMTCLELFRNMWSVHLAIARRDYERVLGYIIAM